MVQLENLFHEFIVGVDCTYLQIPKNLAQEGLSYGIISLMKRYRKFGANLTGGGFARQIHNNSRLARRDKN